MTVAVNDRLTEFLEHYGVKGMRWGVRKTSASRAGGSGFKKLKARSASTQRTRFSKAPKKLSTEELNRRISRMETEKKYNQLNRRDVSAGQRFAADVLGSVGRNVAKTVLTGAGLLAIKTALNSKLGKGVGSEVTRRLK